MIDLIVKDVSYIFLYLEVPYTYDADALPQHTKPWFRIKGSPSLIWWVGNTKPRIRAGTLLFYVHSCLTDFLTVCNTLGVPIKNA